MHQGVQMLADSDTATEANPEQAGLGHMEALMGEGMAMETVHLIRCKSDGGAASTLVGQ